MAAVQLLEGAGRDGEPHEHQKNHHRLCGNQGHENPYKAGEAQEQVSPRIHQGEPGPSIQSLPSRMAEIHRRGEGIAEQGAQQGGTAVHNHGAALRIHIPRYPGRLHPLKGGKEIVDLQGQDNGQKSIQKKQEWM